MICQLEIQFQAALWSRTAAREHFPEILCAFFRGLPVSNVRSAHQKSAPRGGLLGRRHSEIQIERAETRKNETKKNLRES